MAKKKEPPRNRPDNKLWSHIEGRRKFNRIRVYEKYLGSAVWVEWHDDEGRHREPLTTARGTPIFDRDMAVQLAKKMAEAQEKVRSAETAQELLGVEPRHALQDLLAALHRARSKTWKPSYRRDQERFRKFWLEGLGPDAPIRSVTPARVERCAQLAAEANEWKPRTQEAYLRYIVDAFYYAQNKLKWIDEYSNLSAVEFPKYESESKPYTEQEAIAILDAARVGDPRASAAGEITWAAMHRLSAIRQLELTAVGYEVDEKDAQRKMYIDFPPETDKTKKGRRVWLGRTARLAVEKLMAYPAVQMTGLLFPAGNLEDDSEFDPSYPVERGPIAPETLIDLWHAAEAIAGVPWVKGRALNGLVRRAVTEAEKATSRSAVSSQSGKSEQIIPRYVQPDMQPKKDVAAAQERNRRAK